MSDDFYDLHGRRNLFDDKAKAQQIGELKEAYQRDGRKLDQEIGKLDGKVRDLQSRVDRLEQKSSSPKQASDLATAKKELGASQRSLDKLHAKRHAMPEKMELGIDAIKTAKVWQEPDGRIFIHAKVAPSQPSLNYAGENRSGLESMKGFERAHGRGRGTGFECDCGILYAPRELNQHEQRLGIERYTQQLYRQKPTNADLWLTNEIVPHQGTKQLKSNTYTASLTEKGSNKQTEMFSIELRDKPVGGTRLGECHFSRTPRTNEQWPNQQQVAQLRKATKEGSGPTKQASREATNGPRAGKSPAASPRAAVGQGPKAAPGGGGGRKR